MAQFDLTNFVRLLLDTEDDADSPVSEELVQTLREIIVGLLILIFDTGDSGSATSNPPDNATGVLTDTGAAYSIDEHNGRTLLMTSGNAKGLIYTIDDTTATTIVCTGDNLYSEGVRSADTYKILYDIKVNLDGHDHDDVNSKPVAVVADAAIAQAKLKTSQGSVSKTDATWMYKTLPGGEYGFREQFKQSDAGDTVEAQLVVSGNIATTYITYVSLYGPGIGGRYIYAQQRYVTASGEVFWIFLLRDKITKEVISAWQAPDHPCMGNGGKPLLVPHPFGSYDSDKHEIIVINPTEDEVLEMKKRCIVDDETKPDRDLLEIIADEYEIDEKSRPRWPTKQVTVGLPPDWNEAYLERRSVESIKKVIPQPSYILCRKLKLKKE